ncbi:MAG: class I SAM-dependent methyltransferase [Alcanivoracaceae bacterium]|nr:class I SAM-dependent methyltransferase [Alcanivoracaceae bacterium]
MTSEHLFQHSLATLRLRRWPRRRNDRLRAWDSADVLLLDACQALGDVSPVLVANDTCGALALPLSAAGRQVISSGDSWIAWRAMTKNAEDNDLDITALEWQWPAGQPGTIAALALLRVPKSLALFEYQLARLAGQLEAGAPVLMATMDKHAPPGLMSLLAEYLDEVSRDDGRKKAHVYRGRARSQAGDDSGGTTALEVPGLSVQVVSEPGVFSQQQLDPGARFFLQHIPSGVSGNIVDLGCGNGVIGLMAAQRNPDAQVWFCDESAQAIASARRNAEVAGIAGRCHFHHGNGLDGLEEKFDLVLLNPPFHRGHAIDTGVAEMLFDHSRRHLAANGELRVVANRHLPYLQSLRRRFGHVEQVAANSKFTIWSASDRT